MMRFEPFEQVTQKMLRDKTQGLLGCDRVLAALNSVYTESGVIHLVDVSDIENQKRVVSRARVREMKLIL